jgi:hypothetical protein
MILNLWVGPGKEDRKMNINIFKHACKELLIIHLTENLTKN